LEALNSNVASVFSVSSGGPEMIHVSGSANATTVTVVVHSEVLPAASMAVYVTDVVPIGKRVCLGPDT
jgi:hypothetical protein